MAERKIQKSVRQPARGFKCTVEGCERERYGKGLCSAHWQAERQKRPDVAEKKRAYSRWYGRTILRANKKQHNEYQADIRLRRWFGIATVSRGGPEGLAGILEYERRLAEQEGVCAMCKRPPEKGRRLAVDHKHKTQPLRLRGLLCSPCNGRILGRLERFKGHVTIPQITEYLRKYDPENSLLLPVPNTPPDRLIRKEL